MNINTLSTAARPTSQDGAHWYKPDGTPCHTVIAKGTGEPRPTTLRDAKLLGLLPSVTTILKILHRQGLVDWLIEQSVLAALTTPRFEGIKCTKCDWYSAHLTFSDTNFCEKCGAPVQEREPLDAFVYRVLHQERVQDQEAQKARDLGTDMHAGLEALFRGERIEDDLRPWLEPAYFHVRSLCSVLAVETVLVGDGYAGKTDFIGTQDTNTLILDFKTTKKLPEKCSWPEHRLQLSAYAHAYIMKVPFTPIQTASLYISTIDCGKFAYHANPPWGDDYLDGFQPLVKHWQWSTGYDPTMHQAKSA